MMAKHALPRTERQKAERSRRSRVSAAAAGGSSRKVAIQGELGSFSHQAALEMLPGYAVLPCPVSAEVFEALDTRRADAAVIPIENSLAGPVGEHFDLLLKYPFFVRGELRLRIEHNLIAPRGVRFSDIRRVFSHPVALAQCRDFFARNPQIRAEPAYDTAGSVKHVVSGGLADAAAIAGPRAATEHGGMVLRSGLEDDKQNFTRFFHVSRQKAVPDDANKTSLAYGLKNAPGALFKSLSVFALRDISLSKIESRPVRGRPWEYVFFVDILNGDDERARNAIRHLQEISDFVRVLGIYRAAGND
ncbi:MAG TPA: prephenate dehydratase domain-containing protein [Terriglobales bacterium]|nr:prephenate dehydratase domain-containing protein [Terriglobales bacterium]